jgi:hypothetical protein
MLANLGVREVIAAIFGCDKGVLPALGVHLRPSSPQRRPLFAPSLGGPAIDTGTDQAAPLWYLAIAMRANTAPTRRGFGGRGGSGGAEASAARAA